MKGLKIFLLNTVGFVLGYAANALAYYIANLIFGLIGSIRFISNLLSWPVDFKTYAATGALYISVAIGIFVCNFFCNLVDSKMNYGTIFFGLINALTSLIMMILMFANNGFHFDILFFYGISIGTYLVMSFSAAENEF